MRRFVVVALAPIRAHCAAVHMLLQSQLREFPLRLKQLEFGLVELTLQALDALRAFATTVQTTLRTRWGSDDIIICRLNTNRGKLGLQGDKLSLRAGHQISNFPKGKVEI